MAKLSELLTRIVSQDKALANARAAATQLSQRRVERVEVDLFLSELAARKASRSA
ncbi:MAG TPA: hypothetical protein VLI04_01660 [Nocardioidaceae bacterium]|nr:hypothetical protein [Nocardioidaceae bacterium]